MSLDAGGVFHGGSLSGGALAQRAARRRALMGVVQRRHCAVLATQVLCLRAERPGAHVSLHGHRLSGFRTPGLLRFFCLVVFRCWFDVGWSRGW